MKIDIVMYLYSNKKVIQQKRWLSLCFNPKPIKEYDLNKIPIFQIKQEFFGIPKKFKVYF